ncbi:MAG: hypothetical protein RR461_05890 [Angelakisella sp.]
MANSNKATSSKLIIIISIVLVLVVGVFAYLNLNLSKEKSAMSLKGEIAIITGDTEFARITPDFLEGLTAETFTATQKSSGKDPFERTFTGIPLIHVLNEKKVSLETAKQVLMGSLDGYSVALSPEEVSDKDNVWLVWAADGEPLDSKAAPYMIVIRKDPFSQRWSKMLCQITIN